MKVIIDVTRLVRRIYKKETLTGIDRVSLAYIQHFHNQAHAILRYCGVNLILPTSSLAWILNPKSKILFLKILILGFLKKFSQKKHKNSILLNTGHIGFKQKNYERMIIKLKLKPIFIVHDLIPILYPEYCSPGEDVRYKKKLDYILQYGVGIIANSNATLTDITRYYQKINKKMPPSVAALIASSVKLKNNFQKPQVRKPYFVILGTIEPRKNHLLLLQIWRKLTLQYNSQTPHLFIIGKRGWECEQTFDLLDRCETLKKSVTEISRCNDCELINYLSHCQALLFPSFCEGYGLPLVEALSLNAPIIASDLPVFKEIAADIIEYIDPIDSKKWQEVILEYTSMQSKRREQQLSRIRNFKVPTWRSHFIIVDSFLEKFTLP